MLALILALACTQAPQVDLPAPGELALTLALSRPPAPAPAASPSPCRCAEGDPCTCADGSCKCPACPKHQQRPTPKAEPPKAPPQPPAPPVYSLADASGQVWTNADPAYLRSYVAMRNAQIQAPTVVRYALPGPAYSGGGCAGGSCARPMVRYSGGCANGRCGR